MTLKIDCLGDVCPAPVIKLQAQLPQIRRGLTALVVTDHSCSIKAVEEFCFHNGLDISNEEVINGVWEITVSNK